LQECRIRYWLAEPFWGQGITTKAIIKMVDHGFMNFDITRIFARPFGTNATSQRILEKIGFKKVSFKIGLFYAPKKCNFIVG